MGTEHLKGVLSVLSDAKEGDILPINLTTPHPLYSKYAEIWGKCRDASDGEEAIKGIYDHQNAGYSSGGRTRQYLPKLNGQSQEEYANYLSRAHWFGASSRTIGAYLGMIYRKNPQVFYKKERETEIPDDFFNNISVEGASLTDFMHEVTEEIITVNRVGVLVDYPQNSEAQNATSAYEYEEIVKEKRLTPNVSMYKTETIVNWNWTYIDGKLIPMYFVLKEEVYNGIDMGSLAPVKTDIYRILFLEPYEKFYRYKQLVFESVVSGVVSNSNRVTEVITPQMNGKYIPFIPFYILDDKGINFKNIKKPMINDLVNVNVGHFRNSADWENELHIVGHKTLYFPGWDKKVYGNPKIGGALAGPANCEPKMIEASSDSGIRKEMDKKVEEMAVLGSEKISNASGFNTSVPAGRMATASESSTLTLLAGSLGRSFTVIGRFLLQWAGIEDTGINVQVNKDFFQDDITGAEVLEWMKSYQQGGISWDTYFYNLKKKEVYPENCNGEQEKERIKQSLIDQLSISDEKYMDILEKFDKLSSDVTATITSSSGGQTLVSVSTQGGGSNISTSTKLPEGNIAGAEARNNETPGSKSASADEEDIDNKDNPEKVKKKEEDREKHDPKQ